MGREPDPIKLLLGERTPFELDAKTTALLIVDLNVNDAHPEGAVARLARRRGIFDLFVPYYERIRREVTPNVRKLLTAARQAGVTVIYLTTCAPVPGSSAQVQGEAERGVPLALPGSRDAEILAEIVPQRGDIVVTKHTSGAFNSSALDRVLRNLGIEVLVIAGVATHRCVELTARDAADRGYGIILVADACADFTTELHQDALNRMDDGAMTEITTTAELLQRLLQRAEMEDEGTS